MPKRRVPVGPTEQDRASAPFGELTSIGYARTKPVLQTDKYIVGTDGRRLTLADLPLPNTKRWVIRRKAEVVAAVCGGLLSLDEACSRYALTPDELSSWQRCIDRFGLAGLRTTRIQFYLRPLVRPESAGVGQDNLREKSSA